MELSATVRDEVCETMRRNNLCFSDQDPGLVVETLQGILDGMHAGQFAEGNLEQAKNLLKAALIQAGLSDAQAASAILLKGDVGAIVDAPVRLRHTAPWAVHVPDVPDVGRAFLVTGPAKNPSFAHAATFFQEN
eukprot:CAMPEP_0196655292 /NCGR_PEP_ID=MMETSP1086-20130531/5053_1 /TAXON_ID=77921 /ORGANISM="Cyanoptyche  gloeocystis , Strain SAG4.97" /LENGTH=133 /DNA_ID=CAMNT_0041987527 /DNA_START=32 /DNA_END=433 /DNA_ORIENTATION=-